LKTPFPFLLALLIFGQVLSRAGASDDLKPSLYPVDIDGKWGYINRTGHVVIPARYDEAAYFTEGLAAVRVRGRYGYIDPAGHWVIPPRFKYAFAFHEKLAWVDDEPSGFIDRTGRLVLSAPPAGYCREFREGLAKVTPLERAGPSTPQALPSGAGAALSAPAGEGDASIPSPEIGFIDRTGRYTIPPRFEAAWDFSEGMAAVKLNGKWGFIDRTGAIVIEPTFDDASYFSEGAAAVVAQGKTIFIDKAGHPLFRASYEDGLGFREGLAAVKQGGKWGYIGKSGRLVVPAQFDEGASFFNGRAGIVVNARYGYIDRTGKRIVPPIYGYGHFFLGELAGVTLHPERSDGSGTGYVDRQGTIVWKPAPATP
jgi:hypothetical protein